MKIEIKIMNADDPEFVISLEDAQMTIDVWRNETLRIIPVEISIKGNSYQLIPKELQGKGPSSRPGSPLK